MLNSVLAHFVRFVYGHYRLCRLRSRFQNIKIEGPTIIKFDNIDAVNFGKDVYIGPFSEIIVIETTPSSGVRGRFVVGDRVVIGKGANIRAAGGEIVIGEGSLLAQNVSLIAANHSLNTAIFFRDQPWDASRVGVVLKKNVWLGTGVIVLPGVEIGENSVIAAGAVVTKNVPNNQVWAGVPARFVRNLD
jgi:carbonic anhydrase/acetyltransferase-like protein (isoleucine patch superfamily)